MVVKEKHIKTCGFTFNSEYSWNQQNLTVGGRMANDTGDKSSNTLNEVLEKKLDLTQIMESVEKESR
jgi:hypothetical protein